MTDASSSVARASVVLAARYGMDIEPALRITESLTDALANVVVAHVRDHDRNGPAVASRSAADRLLTALYGERTGLLYQSAYAKASDLWRE